MALDFVAGCLGGCAGVLVGHPFDTVKVRLQTQDGSSPKYRGTFHCFSTIIKNESVSGLFRGMSSPMAGVAVINAVVFGIYGNTQKQFTNPDSIQSHFFSGILAGTAQSLIGSPIELAKTRIQIQGLQETTPWLVRPTRSIYTGPVDCLKKIKKYEGFRGVFRGLSCTILRDAPAFAVYFASYEALLQHAFHSKEVSPNVITLMTAGGLAGVFSWIICYPADVIKSRLQVDGMCGARKYSGFLDCAKKSYQEGGVMVFTRGLNSTLLRAFPTNAAIFTVVAWVFKLCEKPKERLNIDLLDNNMMTRADKILCT